MSFTNQQWISLFAGLLTMMVQGSLYVFGTITPYITSYLYYQGSTSIQINDLQIIVTISVLCVNAGMVLPKFPLLMFSNRTMILISLIGISSSVFLVSFASSFTMYALIYGVCFGLFIGYGYVAPLKNCIEHIPNKKGLCSGVCIMGFGIGALFFNLILLQLINPDNKPFDKTTHRFDKDVSNNLPIALRIISGLYLILGLIAVGLIRQVKKQKRQIYSIDRMSQSLTESILSSDNNGEKIQQNNGQNKQTVKQQQQKTKTGKQTDKQNQSIPISAAPLSLKQMLFKKKLIYCMMIIACTMPFGGFIAFYYKQYGMTSITDDRFLTILGSVASIINGISRLFWGSMMDRISFKSIITIMNIIFIICCSTVYFAVQNKYIYLIVVLATYVCYAGNYGVYPTQTVRILGVVQGGKCYWVTFTGFGIGAVIQFVLHYFLVNKFKEDGFAYCFIIFGILLIAGTIIGWKVQFEYHPEELKYVKGMDLAPNMRIKMKEQEQTDTGINAKL